jgi:glycosyltransferase involved in cell wall biosynthesis
MRHLLSISDIYLCPSLSVANGLSQLPEYDPSRMRLTPYGSGSFSPLDPLTEKGRVLFVGAALPRKGLPYLGLAAMMLKDQGFPVKVIVAGEVAQEVRKQPETQCLEFLGVLSRQAIREELARADVFCLPSLTEGSSSAIFEALASGIPVVTTASSGSVIQHGVEGLVVPERDPEAIAAAIRTIVENRNLRERMSNAARNCLDRYSDEAVGSIFIRTIKELQETQG